MAKAIPTKRKKKPEALNPVYQQIDLFKRASEARYRLAMDAYNAQDEETQKVINTMRDRLRIIQTGHIRIWPHGKRQPSVSVPIEPEFQDMNILFVAMEILKDLALLDVQVANYQFPKVYCAECGEKLTPPRRKHATP